ncbi:MAG: cupin domain-containing protein [Chitinophagaceae bacterium]|nr:MAG: cupin domain-containing protein [Chitinophagaceae bacterium]
MELAAFLESGIIETYCLGFTSEEENQLVESMRTAHPEVQAAIEEVGAGLNEVLKQQEIKPTPGVKLAVMHAVYRQHSSEDKRFVPLLNATADFHHIEASLLANQLKIPDDTFSNLYVQELPSTNEVINLAVWMKEGHEAETHADYKEFIAIIEGSCEMTIGDITTSYKAGDIISIPLHISHHAVITSSQPMFAVVQRQLLAV